MSEVDTVQKVDQSIESSQVVKGLFEAFNSIAQGMLYDMYGVAIDESDQQIDSILLDVVPMPNSDTFFLEISEDSRDLAEAIIETLQKLVVLKSSG